MGIGLAYTQVLFDAVVGNIDRANYKASNWAIFLDNQTGERTPSYMYDFNWANLYSLNDEMIEKVASCIGSKGDAQLAVETVQQIGWRCRDFGVEVWVENV